VLETPTKSDLEDGNPNRYRLERFGKAMSGSVSWEVPAAVLNGKHRLLMPSMSFALVVLAHRSTICAMFGALSSVASILLG
jgi:hypothetical protein